jgi:arylsulfatase
MNELPNIVFIHTDQQRGDCLGIEGHPVLQTPNLDGLAAQGTRFTRFYSACPSCIAARRCMLTGQNPQTFGLVGYYEGLEFDLPTLPGVLRENGYQTYHVGRSMHQSPRRKRYGFDDMELSVGTRGHLFGEYEEWFREHAPKGSKGMWGVGIMHNDWTAAPWHLEDHLHFSNWTVNRALRFFERRDPSCPFFLSVGFIAPHPPLQPPAFYFDRYLRSGVPAPDCGDWAVKPEFGSGNDHLSNSEVDLNGEQLLCARAGYYGLINHIDDLLRLILNPVNGVDRVSKRGTIIVFTSDHGEMLGDHYLWRKSLAFESAARVPFIIRAPGSFGVRRNTAVNAPATHADIMPTILDMLNIDVPDTVDGRSLYPLLKGEKVDSWRDCIHIEHAPNHQCVTDGRRKYIWAPVSGKEYFFNLDDDPRELHNLSGVKNFDAEISEWRTKLIQLLQDRPEGFVESGKLVSGKKYAAVIPVSNTD